MKRLVSWVAGICVLGYVAVCVVLFAQQRSQIYFPHAHSPLNQPETRALSVNGTPIYFATLDRPGSQALVYFGGNADDVSLTLPLLAETFPNHALYLLHYRSYGGTPGQPTEAALLADALALFDKANSEHRKVLLVGRSLGTGLAVHVASLRPAARMVLITPYASLADMAAQRYPYIPVNWLLLDRFDSKDYAQGVSAPTLLIAAEQDEVIPMASTRSLLSHFRPGIAQLQIIPGVGHGSILGSASLRPFLTQVQSSP